MFSINNMNYVEITAINRVGTSFASNFYSISNKYNEGSSSMKKIYISLGSVLILTLCIFLNAHANLIVNGDFNSGLDNWNSSGYVQAVHAGPFAAIQGMDGNYALMGFGTTGTDSFLNQVFDVTGLDQLTISFNYAFDYVDWSTIGDDAFISCIFSGWIIWNLSLWRR